MTVLIWWRQTWAPTLVLWVHILVRNDNFTGVSVRLIAKNKTKDVYELRFRMQFAS